MTGLTTRQIGDSGEKIVASLLPNAIHINEFGEKRLPYDVEWNGIKIDVKTSIVNSKRPLFKILTDETRRGVVLVMLLIIDNNKYFWVDKHHDGIPSTRRFEDCIPEEDLPIAIKDIYNQPNLPLTKFNKYKNVSITELNMKYYERIIDKWARKHEGVQLTLPKIINLAMQKLEEQI